MAATEAATDGRAERVAVIGAGIVGLCAALSLQRAGLAVCVYDPLPPGSGASYGNAGLLSIDSCVPMSMPGMLRNVPRWLTDPNGPLALRPGYALKALPWLLQWLRAGRMAQVRASSDALFALHQPSLEQYRLLLGPELFAQLVRTPGHLHVWESAQDGTSDRVGAELREGHGIPTEALDAGQVHDLVPELSSRIVRGLFYPRHAHTVEPRRLVQAIAGLLQQAGGQIRQEQVMKIVPLAADRLRLLTSTGDHEHDRVVVAAGAWSRRLIEPLGASMLLETERGYHLELRQPSIDLALPVVHRDKGFAATPMDTGLRIAGTVEIAGLQFPPDERRADALWRHAKDMLPALEYEARAAWMGFRPSMPDSLPVIDRVPGHPGVFVAAGHGHFGMTAASMTGRLITQMVTGEPPALDLRPYRIDRF